MAISVNADQLRSLSSAYRDAAQDIRDRSSQLAGQTDGLLHDWIGSGSSAFQSLAQSVDARQHELVDTMEKMADVLLNAAQAFDSADNNISSALEP